ncbi:unnamed protein product [Prorocentrum cordatum]|uniref:Uncharacterized protein n=1 Tax=Prorocentrum cordatum TaxID=2364126 RepID=A0ABN9TRP5_9DINO|nr:unnamed protein product [Polarella glacialis]
MGLQIERPFGGLPGPGTPRPPTSCFLHDGGPQSSGPSSPGPVSPPASFSRRPRRGPGRAPAGRKQRKAARLDFPAQREEVWAMLAPPRHPSAPPASTTTTTTTTTTKKVVKAGSPRSAGAGALALLLALVAARAPL